MVKFLSTFSNKKYITYVSCVALYIIARVVLQLFADYKFRHSFPGWGWVYFLNTLFYTMTLLCGCIVSIMIHEKSIIHASLVTALGVAVCTFVTKTHITDYGLFFSGIAMGAVLGGGGGGIVFLVRKLRYKQVSTPDQ
ncbi:hypothetical protein [Trabulsiella odontotermitis]|uniref:Uncharacterized protein n=1 Tax=Trabulsiella odontotermitis TaxID=379893 RepID=A0A0L0GKS3_9ENTR|nr:hypothetical protein [Trabulsiella odontotermitis]KNC89018.1 hypothetical protein GM31_08075 [Trabulsiella odontotermitis]